MQFHRLRRRAGLTQRPIARPGFRVLRTNGCQFPRQEQLVVFLFEQIADPVFERVIHAAQDDVPVRQQDILIVIRRVPAPDRGRMLRGHQRLGNPVTIVERLTDWAADELIYLDLNTENRGTILEALSDIARRCVMPLTFGGRIRTLEDAGSDKFSVNTRRGVRRRVALSGNCGFAMKVARVTQLLRRARSRAFGRLSLPTASMEVAFPDSRAVRVSLEEYAYEYGDMPVQELVALCQIAKAACPRTMFEIGTYKGGTTLQLAVNTDANICTLDLPPKGHQDYEQPRVWDPESDVYPDLPGERFHKTKYAPRITQVLGDSRTFDFAPYEGKMDVVFVDACHHYEYVIKDSRTALKLVSPKGMVLWHDYADYAPGVQKALHELKQEVALTNLTGTSLVVFQNGVQ